MCLCLLIYWEGGAEPGLRCVPTIGANRIHRQQEHQSQSMFIYVYLIGAPALRLHGLDGLGGAPVSLVLLGGRPLLLSPLCAACICSGWAVVRRFSSLSSRRRSSRGGHTAEGWGYRLGYRRHTAKARTDANNSSWAVEQLNSWKCHFIPVLFAPNFRRQNRRRHLNRYKDFASPTHQHMKLTWHTRNMCLPHQHHVGEGTGLELAL